MKKFLVFVVAAAFSVSTFAQTRSVNAIHIGGNMSTFTGSDLKDYFGEDGKKSTLGYQVGFTKDFGSFISIEPGIFLIHKGVAYKDGDWKSSVGLNYLQIPINVKVNLELGSMRLQAGLGVYASYGLWGKGKDDDGTDKDDYKIKFTSKEPGQDDEWQQANAFDFGGQVFAGLHFGRFGVTVSYQPGFASIMKGYDDNNKYTNLKINNSSICLSLSYQLSDPDQ